MTAILTPKFRSVDVRQEGERVLVIENGRTILDLPWDAAQALARAILAQANRAEEVAKAEQVVFDNAILLRAGVPVGLTSNPVLLGQSVREAQSNSKLRRYMPGGIKSKEAFGTPRIIRHRKVKSNG